MASILKQRIIVRRFKYLANSFINNESHRNRVSSKLIPPLHPSQIRTARNFVRLGGIISNPIEVHSRNFKPSLENLKKLFVWKRPNGNGKKNGTDQKEQRDLEIKKLQDLRQRSIDHIYDQESVWKAMKERDELLRRDRNDKNEEKSEKDETK